MLEPWMTEGGEAPGRSKEQDMRKTVRRQTHSPQDMSVAL
jgi:hypothetical protein